MKIENYKTLCCKSTWHKERRAVYICDECGEDVTLELVLLRQVLNDE